MKNKRELKTHEPGPVLSRNIINKVIASIPSSNYRLFFELLLKTGLRSCEVLRLRPIEIKHGKLSIHKKNCLTKIAKPTDVCISQEMYTRLVNYVRTNNVEPDQNIFPISGKRANSIFSKAAQKQAIKPQLHIHQIRIHCITTQHGPKPWRICPIK